MAQIKKLVFKVRYAPEILIMKHTMAWSPEGEEEIFGLEKKGKGRGKTYLL